MTEGRRAVPPHITTSRCTTGVMGDVCIALVPPSVAAVYFFGMAAAVRLAVAVIACAAAAAVSNRRRGEAPDGCAPVTGLILALSCPAGIPLWLLVVLCLIAIWLVREGFGGVGKNLYNPAMAARALLLTVFPMYAGGYGLPDAASAATPLAEEGAASTLQLWSLFWGRVNGSMGETSVLMILLGMGYLLIRRVIRLRTPLGVLAGFSVVMLVTGQPVVTHLLSGSIIFGAVYIFTDYAGQPTTDRGEWMYAVGAGALTALLRVYGTYPEGVCFAALLMNMVSPVIERYTMPRVYGYGKRRRKAR